MKWNHRAGFAVLLSMIISYLNPAKTLLKMFPWLDMILLLVGIGLLTID